MHQERKKNVLDTVETGRRELKPVQGRDHGESPYGNGSLDLTDMLSLQAECFKDSIPPPLPSPPESVWAEEWRQPVPVRWL